MNPNAKFSLNIFTIFLAGFLIFPTAAILASWNSLPGDTLYSTKRTLEKAALALTAPNYKTNSRLQTTLIARRTSEATDTIVQKSSTRGLDELRDQVDALQMQIQLAPTIEDKQRITQTAITQLQDTKTKLAETKTTLTYSPPAPPTTTSTQPTITQQIITYIQVPGPQPQPPSATTDNPPEVVTSSEDELIDEIEEVEEEIDQVIDDILEESFAPETTTIPTPDEGFSGPGQGQGSGLDTAPGQQRRNFDDSDDHDDDDKDNDDDDEDRYDD